MQQKLTDNKKVGDLKNTSQIMKILSQGKNKRLIWAFTNLVMDKFPETYSLWIF